MMKQIMMTLLMVAAAAWPTVAIADDVSIPTDSDHPFDLTQGTVSSSKNNNKFTDFGVENMYDGDQLTYSLQNREELDVCNVYVYASTGYNSDVQLSVRLANAEGREMADTTFTIVNKGWKNALAYSLRAVHMTKGKYTLTLTFHQTRNANWTSVNIAGISFLKPQVLRPGDDVDIVNPEFDDALNGWTREGYSGSGLNTMMWGNNSGLASFWNSTGQLAQTAYNIPDGLYLLRMCAYDSYSNLNDTPDTYVFLNNRQVPMKTAYDDAVGYRNIYRLADGQSVNNSWRRTDDGRWVPTNSLAWNECLAMAERLYAHCVVVAVSDGKATFGWKKTEKRGTRVLYDHVRLTYLSADASLEKYAGQMGVAAGSDPAQAIEQTILAADLRDRLASLKRDIRTELAVKRAHAPQAIAEAEAAVNADSSHKTHAELTDDILHLEHLMTRLKLPFHHLTVSSPGSLATQLEEIGIQTADTIALKVSGTPNDADVARLKTQTNLMELDLEDTSLTSLAKESLKGLKQLTWLTLPSKIETIGESALRDCYRLRDLSLPATLHDIGQSAFYACYSFDHAVIPEGVTVGTYAYCTTGLRSIVLPQSMGTVPAGLCQKCSDLNHIVFNGQQTIAIKAFESCTSLKTVDLPESLTWMDSECFNQCSALANATLPARLTYAYRPFSNCMNMTTLTCLAIAPPCVSGQSIHGQITSKGFTLRVPRMSVDAYQAAEKWNEFNIEGIDVLPSVMSIVSPLTIDDSYPLPSGYSPDISLTALYSYWGGDVASMPSRGTLTASTSSMLSARRLTQLYNPFALRSTADRQLRLTTHTSLINNGQMRADEVTINLWLYENKWEFLSFPFDVRVGDIRSYFGDVPLAIYGYDGEKRAEGRAGESWVRMTADSTLHAGKGYIWQTVIPYSQQEWRKKEYANYNYHFNRFYVDALQNATKPLFFRNEDVEVTLEKHYAEFAHDRSWNFMGNPYPCYYDISAMETTAPIIVWTFSMTSIADRYKAYSPLDDDLILFPGQAFFVQCPLDEPTLLFHKEGRQHDLTFHRYDVEQNKKRARTASEQRRVFNLFLDKEEQDTVMTLDQTRFVLNEHFTQGYDVGRDASKFESLDASAAEIYLLEDGVRYAIDERPLGDGSLALGLRLPSSDAYILRLDTKDTETPVLLIDHQEGVSTRLDGRAGGYAFTAGAGIDEGRFTLLVGDAATGMRSVDGGCLTQPCRLYDLQGRGVTPTPAPGLYIRNGKKVIIK